jgi:hypothetical protein
MQLYQFTILRIALTICLSVLLLIPAAWAASGPSEYQVKAAFLYQFTKYTKWPGVFSLDSTSQMNICLWGSNPFGEALSLFDKASSAKLTISVKKNISSSDIASCHMLYIAKGAESQLSSILSQAKASPVLTVSEIKGFSDQGGMIEIQTVEKTIGVFERNNVGLVINTKAAGKVAISFDAQLLEIAKSVIR